MKYVMVAVRDSALDIFMRPFVVPTVAAAVRTFGDEVNNRESPMFKHPTDYTLFRLGAWDEDTGAFENVSPPEQVARAADLFNKEVKS